MFPKIFHISFFDLSGAICLYESMIVKLVDLVQLIAIIMLNRCSRH